MRVLKYLLPAFLVLLSSVRALACNCEPVQQLGAADWNDADIIFTATLLEHRMGMVGMLRFEPRKSYKGQGEPGMTFYFQPGKDHTLLHAVKEFRPGDEWVVFATKKNTGNREYYRLKASPNRADCALSRPVQEDDPYLTFLEEMARTAGGHRKMYDEQGRLTAEGAYLEQVPVSRWAYYEPERETVVSGNYENGRREGEWLLLKEMPGGKKQAIRKTIYNSGSPAEIHDYSHTGTISLKKILTDSTETRFYFRPDGALKNRIHANLEENTTHIISYSETGAIEEERFLEAQKVVRQYRYNEKGERIEEGQR
ncbi:MAG: hypothetical protein J5I94_29445 [Phaeodactylibacter sp.]|nr:hypothetical protein [Phaeodactylibacter sp.]